jgi:virulence-associated protein VagC
MKTARAKLFQNGGSQAARLPKECRFTGPRPKQLRIRDLRDPFA